MPSVFPRREYMKTIGVTKQSILVIYTQTQITQPFLLSPRRNEDYNHTLLFFYLPSPLPPRSSHHHHPQG